MNKRTLLILLLAILTPAGIPIATAQLRPELLDGKWIADSGNGPAQIFIFETRGTRTSGVTCGPCGPDGEHLFVIEDGSIRVIGDGSITEVNVTFYVRHDDRGEGLAEYGPYRDVFTGTIANNEMHVRWHREGGGENEVPHGELVLIGPLRRPILPPRTRLPAPANPNR